MSKIIERTRAVIATRWVFIRYLGRAIKTAEYRFCVFLRGEHIIKQSGARRRVMAKDEIRELADMLCLVHGKAQVSLGEAAKILDINVNNIRHYLHADGISVKKAGKSKMVSAIQLAEFMALGCIAAIDSTGRGTILGGAVEIPRNGGGVAMA